ncbi:MAG TPA: hypothetical protein DCL48_08675 [Alphaproteobacteria bacterium]|nr:hypothetical protein [Alphaproteobacteria bacterium]
MTEASTALTRMDGREPLWRDALTASAVTLILLAAAYGAVQTGSLLIYWLPHAVVSLVLVAMICIVKPVPRRQAALLVICVPALGPFGAAGCLICIAAEASFRNHARGFLEWYAELFPDEESERADVLLRRLLAGGDPAHGASELASFADVMEHGSIEQKQALAALIARRFSPAFAPDLRRALEDPVPAVRVQAAAAAAAIEARFAARTMALQREALRAGDAPDTLRRLGHLHAEIAASGLLEEARAAAARAQALDCFHAVLAANASDGEALLAAGELHLANAEPNLAAVKLLRALELNGVSVRAAELLIEALLKERRFKELRTFAIHWQKKLPPHEPRSARLRAALQTWAETAA